ncbi:MAG: DNA topoisomerase VI subunit B, partial [Planctomycetota bacterium]
MAKRKTSAKQMNFEFGAAKPKGSRAKERKVKPKKTKPKTSGKSSERKTKVKSSGGRARVKRSEKRKATAIAATAESMAAKQRAISISEFFAKNRHLLGFDNPRKALLTATKEAVDNSLDACEEAHILPDLLIEIKALSDNKFT